MGMLDKIRFLTEPANSEDFGKSRDDWKASKDAKKKAAEDKKNGKGE
jgi:hypothetical protein